MPFLDLFREFLGLPSQEKITPGSGFRKPPADSEEDDNDSDISLWFDVFSGNMQDIHRHLQHQMDDIMKTFDSPWFGNAGYGNFFGIMDSDNIENSFQPEGKEDINPRNRFLKPSREPERDLGLQSEEDKSKEIQIPHHRNDGFGIFSSHPLEIHKFFEQQIDDIMKRFSSSSSWFHFDEGNILEFPDQSPGRVEEFVHPRNKFFKPSYEPPQRFKPDSDIDDESYAPKVFGKLLDKEPVQPPSSSFISRSTVMTHQRKMLPNGGIEERRKCIKDGKEEVTISRQLGDLKHIVTTVKLPDGTTTKNEEFINFDAGQLKDFNKSWNKM